MGAWPSQEQAPDAATATDHITDLCKMSESVIMLPEKFQTNLNSAGFRDILILRCAPESVDQSLLVPGVVIH